MLVGISLVPPLLLFIIEKSELKIRSQSGPRRKKAGFICSKPLKKKC